mgnify:CR=1 FL=1|tara:strand:- start:242 stop:556 length:315 start_codon:yes stop_codon:yes gene_type:complete
MPIEKSDFSCKGKAIYKDGEEIVKTDPKVKISLKDNLLKINNKGYTFAKDFFSAKKINADAYRETLREDYANYDWIISIDETDSSSIGWVVDLDECKVTYKSKN